MQQLHSQFTSPLPSTVLILSVSYHSILYFNFIVTITSVRIAAIIVDVVVLLKKRIEHISCTNVQVSAYKCGPLLFDWPAEI